MELTLEQQPAAGSSEKRITITPEINNRILINIRFTRSGTTQQFAIHRKDLPRLACFFMQAVLQYYKKID